MRSGTRRLTPEQAQARLEDCRFMADTGEHLDGAARRLGLTRNTLEKWLERNDRDTLATLVARQPRDHNRFVDQDRRMSIGQITGQTARRQATKKRARSRALQEAA